VTECELTNNCDSFYESIKNMPSTSRLMKGAYCKGDYSDCARYKVYTVQGREKVPVDLCPSDLNRASKLLTC
jgi:hypothetical protein